MNTFSAARRPSRTSERWVALIIIALGILLGLAAALGKGATLVGIISVISVAAVGIRRRWGVAVCLGPVFLLPVTTMTNLPSSGFLHWRFILAIVSAALATSYWRSGAGRPRLNPWALGSVGFLGVALLVLGRRNGIAMQESLSLPLFAYSGLIVGQCLRDPVAIKSIAYLAVPLAILAIFEAIGLQNVWATLLHASAYEALATAGNATRTTSSFGHPLIAGACLTAAGLLLLSIRQRPATFAGIICLVGAATTVSRSALLGGALGIAVFALQTRGHRIRVFATAAVLVLSAFVAITSVPQLDRSFNNRVLNLNHGQLTREESVRENSLTLLKEEINVDPGRLLIGGGVGYSTILLAARGGNAAGYYIFDNEYVTMMYDAGLIVVLSVFALLACAARNSDKHARRRALPALAAIAVIMYFVDGMAWPSLSVVAWMVIGLFTVRRSNVHSPNTGQQRAVPARDHLTLAGDTDAQPA